MTMIFIGVLCIVSGAYFLTFGLQDEEPMVKRSQAIQTIKQAYIKGWADGATYRINNPRETYTNTANRMESDLKEFEKIITIKEWKN